MRLKPIILFFSAVILLFAVSCKNGGKSGLLVPKDATIVIHVNSSSLTSKLSWTEISQTGWFQDAAKDVTDTLALRMLKDPAASGVDTKADLVFYLKKQGRGGYMVFEGSIKDAAAFESFNKQLNKGVAAVKDGDYNHMEMEKEGLLTWNKSSFAYLANAPMPDMSQAFTRSSSYEPYNFPADSLIQFGKNALSLKSGDNLDNDSRFASLIKDGSDVHLWMNAGSVYGNTMGGALSMMKFNTLLEDNLTAASLNFDDGKMSVNATQYFGKEMSKLLSDYPAKSISADVINRLPSQNVVGLLAYNYPPEGLKEFLKMIGVDGLANGFLGRVGYSIDEFVKANKGDMLLAVYDFQMGPKSKQVTDADGNTTTQTDYGPDMKVLFATSINDKPAFDKLVTIAGEQLKGAPAGKIPEISYKLDNNWFAASNSAEGVDKFLAGSNPKNPMADKLSGHPFGFYIDLQKIISSSQSAVTDSFGKAGLTASANMWENIISTGGDYKNKGLSYKLEVNLVDKKTNSLKQLNQYFDTLYKIDQEKKKQWSSMPPAVVDSVVVAPKP